MRIVYPGVVTFVETRYSQRHGMLRFLPLWLFVADISSYDYASHTQERDDSSKSADAVSTINTPPPKNKIPSDVPRPTISYTIIGGNIQNESFRHLHDDDMSLVSIFNLVSHGDKYLWLSCAIRQIFEDIV